MCTAQGSCCRTRKVGESVRQLLPPELQPPPLRQRNLSLPDFALVRPMPLVLEYGPRKEGSSRSPHFAPRGMGEEGAQPAQLYVGVSLQTPTLNLCDLEIELNLYGLWFPSTTNGYTKSSL